MGGNSSKISDEDFIKMIGRKVGKGLQGTVYTFEDDKVVKVFTKLNDIDEINNEFTVGTFAGDSNCGPKVYEIRFIDNKAYIVMEKLMDVKLKQSNKEEVIELFEKLIDKNIINVDGGFGRKDDGTLVLYDFGVSKISKSRKETIEEYEDYFYSFGDFYKIKGLKEYYYDVIKNSL